MTGPAPAPIRLGPTTVTPRDELTHLLILGAAMIVGAVVAAAIDPSGFGVVAAMIGCPVLAWFGNRRRLRLRRDARAGWLWVFDGGFVVRSAAGEEWHADTDVATVAATIEPAKESGWLVAYRRTVTLGRTNGRSPVVLTCDDRTLTTDPLGPLLGRLRDRLVDAARAAGGTVAGDDWSLDADGLRFVADNEVRRLPLERVVAVEEVAGHICVWEAGDPQAVFRRSCGSPNVLLLCELIRPVASPAEDDGLGRLLGVRDTGTDERQTATVMALIFTAVSGLGWWWFLSGGADKMAALAFIGPVVVVAALVRAWERRVDVFRRHENGVTYTNAAGTRQARYADLTAFGYSAEVRQHGGEYIHTQATLRFTPADGDSFTYTAEFSHNDPTVDAVRERAVAAVAGSIVAELAAGRSVVWADGLILHPHGLGLPGGEVLPYAAVGWRWNDELLVVTRAATGDHVVVLKPLRPNIFPVLEVIRRRQTA